MITTTSNASDRPNKIPSNVTEVLDVLVDFDRLLFSVVEAVVITVTVVCCTKIVVACVQDGGVVTGVFIIVAVFEGLSLHWHDVVKIQGSCKVRSKLYVSVLQHLRGSSQVERPFMIHSTFLSIE